MRNTSLYNNPQLIVAGVTNSIIDTTCKYRDSVIKGTDKAVEVIYAYIAASNFAAFTYMVDVIDYIEEIGKLKFKVKKYATHACDVYYRYRRLAIEKDKMYSNQTYNGINRLNLWDDQNNQIYKQIEDDILNLENTIKQMLDNELDSKNNVLFAKLIAARMMIELAIQRCDKVFEAIADEYSNGYNFQIDYPETNLTDMWNWWFELTNALTGNRNVPNVKSNEQCKKAFYILDNKFRDKSIYNNAGLAALKFDSHCDEIVKEIELKRKNKNNDGSSIESEHSHS